MKTSLITAALSLSILIGEKPTMARRVRDPHSPFVGQYANTKIIHHEQENAATIALERKPKSADNELLKQRNQKRGIGTRSKQAKSNYVPDVNDMNLEEYLAHNKPLMKYFKELIFGRTQPFPERKSSNSKHRLGQSYTIQQTNHYNFEYVGPLFMGSSSEETSVVYDTGSDWLVVGTEKCSNCVVPTYSTGTSNDYNNLGMVQTGQRLYGSTSLEGFEVFDKVCLINNNACVPNFYWFEITAQEGMNEVNGIMGLSTGFTDQNGPLYMEALGEAGALGSLKFGVAFKGLTSQSFIDIGTFKDSSMNNPQDLVEFTALNNFWWAQTITGLRFGTGESAAAFSIAPDFCMTDTGTSLVYIPESMYNVFMDKVLENVDSDIYQEDGDDIITLCTPSAYPVVSILYAGYWAEILPEDYILDVSLAGDESICMVGFTFQGDDEGWMLGDVFLRGFYATHDMDNKVMGFAPSSGSRKNKLVSGEAPDETLEEGRSRWFWILIFTLVTIVVVVVVLTVFMGSYVPKPPILFNQNISNNAKKRAANNKLSSKVVRSDKSAVQIRLL